MDGERLDDLTGLLVVNPEDAAADDGDEGSPEAKGQPDTGAEADEADADTTADDAESGDDSADGNPEGDEGTDADDQSDDDGEPEDDKSAARADAEEPEHTVTIDGKSQKVTLKELRDGYQRQADYSRKTGELAEQRKALDTDTTAMRTHRDQYANLLKVLNERLGADEPTPEQWSALREQDPNDYAIRWAEHQQRKEAREAVAREQARVADEQKAETVKTLKAYVDEQRGLLVDKLPEWKDPAKLTEGVKAVREYAGKAFGFSKAELDQAYDHRIIVMAEKAMRYDEIMSKREAVKKKLQSAPEMPAPANRGVKPNRKAEQRKAAQDKFDRSGRVDDAVPLMFK